MSVIVGELTEMRPLQDRRMMGNRPAIRGREMDAMTGPFNGSEVLREDQLRGLGVDRQVSANNTSLVLRLADLAS